MRNRNPQALADLSSTDKPTKQTTLQLAAFAVIILVIGIVGGIEQNRMPLLPGAAVMFMLIALAGWLVHKSNDTEEEIGTKDIDAPVAYHALAKDAETLVAITEVHRQLDPDNRRKFLSMCKRKAALRAGTRKAAGSKNTTIKHLHYEG